MRAPAAGVELHGGWLLLGVLLVGYLVAGQPLVGGWSQRRFRETAGADPGARLARYRRTLRLEWGLFAGALVLLVGAPGLRPRELGVAWPRLSGGGAPYTLAGTLGLAASVLLLVGLRRRVDRGTAVAAPAEVLALLPRTTAERRVFAGVAVTAGVCEETLYRGVLLALAVAAAPGLPPVALAVLSAAAFGLAHVYQGVAGTVTTTVLGGSLAVLFLGTGSLLLPVLYHVLVDLRVLVLAVDRRWPRHRARPARLARPAR